MGRELVEELARHRLPVEPLLQHIEALDPALAQNEQLTVDRALERDRVSEIGEGFGDVLSRARVDFLDLPALAVAPARELHPDAVPLPLGGEGFGLEFVEILEFFHRVRQHRWAKRRRVAALGPLSASLDPAEQLDVGRLQAVPDLLHRIGLVAAERADCGLGEPGRDADPQVAGDELQERPAPGLVEGIEPARQMLRQRALRGGGQRLDHFC
ncbi:hypothetical protein GCM10025880_03140 [Methylorubrum aminovorans]|nr:hypothetical protein GCM10025880_03140 [Methylorubrum aminovorans]